MRNRLPDIDTFARRFAAEINRILCPDRDPRVKRIERLRQSKGELTDLQREDVKQALEGVAERVAGWANKLKS